MIKMTLGQAARILGLKAYAKPQLANTMSTPIASNDVSYNAYLENETSTPKDYDNLEFTGISIDTRTLKAGNLFVALAGSQVDGHQYLADAQQKGAIGALVARTIASNLPQLLVDETGHALGKLAATWRNQFTLPIIAVTGSNGKTTLKNMLRSILLHACANNQSQVLATKGNFNNHLGLPLTLAELNEQHRFAIIEMGMNHFGEIEYLTKMTRPTVAVINNAAPAHLEGVGDLAGVAKAKAEIFIGLSQEGTAILNRDDAFYAYWREQIGRHQFLSFGLHEDADVTLAALNEISKPNQVYQRINIKTPIGKLNVALPLIGKHNVLNALAATAAALNVGVDLESIKAGLEKTAAEHGRLQIFALDNGIKLIDDTYNTNPLSLQAAVEALSYFSGKKILVMGDMKELGTLEKEFHREAGLLIREAKIDFLFTFGELSAYTAHAFGEGAYHFNEQPKLIRALKPFLCHPATILVKGSRSMHMEFVVQGLMQ